jgi:hypothetical protein
MTLEHTYEDAAPDGEAAAPDGDPHEAPVPAATALRDRALALRQAGRSRDQICAELGITQWRLSVIFTDAPVRRPDLRVRAKDEARIRARGLRGSGWTVTAIAKELGVSRSSVSLWVRDVPCEPWAGRDAHMKRLSELGPLGRTRAYQIKRDATTFSAQSDIGALSQRELLLIGTALYWAEGMKSKTYARRERVQFTNSDPAVIRVFLDFLGGIGVAPERLRYRVSIHESADVASAERFWADVAGVDVTALSRVTLKRHNATPGRYNIRSAYHGCLVVSVLDSREVYQRIDGWWRGIAASCGWAAGAVDPA